MTLSFRTNVQKKKLHVYKLIVLEILLNQARNLNRTSLAKGKKKNMQTSKQQQQQQQAKTTTTTTTTTTSLAATIAATAKTEI